MEKAWRVGGSLCGNLEGERRNLFSGIELLATFVEQNVIVATRIWSARTNFSAAKALEDILSGWNITIVDISSDGRLAESQLLNSLRILLSYPFMSKW